MAQGRNGPNGDPYLRRIFEEMREIRRELRDDRRRADATAAADRREAAEDRRRADANMVEIRQDLLRSHAETREAWRDLRSVGLAIVRTLNRHTKLLESHTRLLESHTRLLEGIDRKLGGRRNGHGGNGRHR